jgi:hypothetical protein
MREGRCRMVAHSLSRNPGRDYISVPRAAVLLGISPRSMAALLDRGVIPSIRPMSHRRVLVADVLRYRDGVSENVRNPIPALTDDPLRD